MGTWICHLRIAETLLDSLPELDEIAFTFGNLAPDSGVPNADWSQFDPPTEITHFSDKGGGEEAIRDLEFYRGYLSDPHVCEDNARYSFLLGYWFHLLTDNLWSHRVWRATKAYFSNLVAAKGVVEAGWMVKKDWYDLDHLYVRDHRDSLFWRVYLNAPLPASYLPFLPDAAVAHQIAHIRKFYGEPEARELNRVYPYLNEASMARFVDGAAASILKLYRAMSAGEMPIDGRSAVALLPAEEKAFLPPPLGDENR